MAGITVSGPGGATISFPEGTDAATIDGVMRQHFAGKSGGDGQAPADPDAAITTNRLVRSAATGIPILGGLANKGNAAINATLAPVMNPLFSDKDQLKGATWGERYQNSLNEQNAGDEAFHEAHPVVDTAAQLAGGAAATAPVAATTTGANLLGLTGRTLVGQAARGAASGAAINAADAAVRGGDVGPAAMIGGAVGGGAPVVARTIGALAQPVVNTVRGIINPTEEAARRVATAADRDIAAASSANTMAGLTPQEFSTARQAGTPVMNMDIGGETTRALARSAANTSPEGRAILNRAIDDRYQGQAGRLSDWLNSTFNYPNAFEQQRAITESARAANTPAYQRAMDEAAQRHPAGLWDPTFEQLSQDPTVQAAIRRANVTAASASAREGFTPVGNPFVMDPQTGRMVLGADANGTVARPTLQFWDTVKRELDGVGSYDARAAARALRQHIDTTVPSYGEARAGAAHFFGAENALEAGQNFVSSRLDNRAARDALSQMTDQQRQLFQDGFVSRFVEQMREVPDRANVLNRIGQSPAARERLNIALGPQRSAELEAMLRTENIMDRARGAVQGNSTTARQLVELGLAGGANTALGGGNPLADPGAMMNTLLIYGAMKGARGGVHAIDSRVATQVARLLTSNDPAQLRMGMQMVARNPGLMSALRNADTALARAGAVQATPSSQQGPAR